MVSAGSDGSVKIWNFSNGSSLKNLLTNTNDGKEPKEVTALVSVFDRKDEEKPSFFVAAGWDRRLRIWPDDKESEEENVPASRDLPTKYSATNATQQSHGDDIMCATYDFDNNLVFTGGHDGTLLAWHFETGFIKFYMHTQDDSCTDKFYI
jgi:WD40 repeat protein